ncbi:MAG TPA: hypothetical protein VFE23_17130 [Usitatibacter sp.]|jgi:hypothetical protein|nr:hypothetical protein [Usitatibacter sp.]
MKRVLALFAVSAATFALADSKGPLVLIDATGKVAARYFQSDVAMIEVDGGAAVPVPIENILDPGAGGVLPNRLRWVLNYGQPTWSEPDCKGIAYTDPYVIVLGRASSVWMGTLYYAGDGPGHSVQTQSYGDSSSCFNIPSASLSAYVVEGTIKLETVYPSPLRLGFGR